MGLVPVGSGAGLCEGRRQTGGVGRAEPGRRVPTRGSVITRNAGVGIVSRGDVVEGLGVQRRVLVDSGTAGERGSREARRPGSSPRRWPPTSGSPRSSRSARKPARSVVRVEALPDEHPAGEGGVHRHVRHRRACPRGQPYRPRSGTTARRTPCCSLPQMRCLGTGRFRYRPVRASSS